jgi:hypothetical protein
MSKLLNKRIEVLRKNRSNNHMHSDSKKHWLSSITEGIVVPLGVVMSLLK